MVLREVGSITVYLQCVEDHEGSGVAGEDREDERAKNIHYILPPKLWDGSEGEGEGVDGIHSVWHRVDGRRRRDEKRMGISEGI